MPAVDWTTCRGRNGWDHPLAIPDDMGAEMLNVEFVDGGLGKKRRGAPAVSIGGDSYSGHKALIIYVPAQDPTDARLIIVSADATTKVLSVQTASATNLTLTNAIASNPQLINGAVLNGKLFLAWDSTANRVNVLNPSQSATTIRPAGLATPVAPTAANTGSGSYAATQRWYRVRFQVIASSVVLYQSNVGPALAFTPSGSGTAAQVTKPASAGEGETHWVLSAAAQSIDGPYYDIATTVVGTTTYDDSANPATYNANDASPLDGHDYPFPAVKYVASDGERLFGFGTWEAAAGASITPQSGVVYYTPALGESNTGDDERLEVTTESKGWINLSINAGGVDRGIGGPMLNLMYFFQNNGIYALSPTGSATIPFRRIIISRQHGAVSHKSIVMGQDEAGNDSLYFLDERDGPRRIVNGYNVQWLGKDVFDLWPTVNLSATGTVAFGVYDQRYKLVIWWVATGASNDPDTILAYDVTRGRMTALHPGEEATMRYGWLKWTGAMAAARCGVMFPTTLAAARPLTMCPYVGLTSGTTLLRQDGTTQQDNGASHQGYVKSKAFRWDPLTRTKRITESYLEAKAQAATTIRQTITRDWGLESFADDASIAASGSETYVRPRFEATDVSRAITLQVQLGDSAAANSTWELDGWTAEVELQSGSKK